MCRPAHLVILEFGVTTEQGINMATGGIGGIPTVSEQTFSFSSNLTNFVFYTCPANTISYVVLNSLRNVSGINVVTEIGLTQSDGVAAWYKNFLSAAVSMVSLINYPLEGLIQFPKDQIDNPYLVKTTIASSITTTDLVHGQLILYPGQSLYITNTLASGGPSATLKYRTLEITAGS